MKKQVLETGKLNNEIISEMFCEYVSTMADNGERHTEKACAEVDKFDKFCERIFPNDTSKQTEVFDKMMEVAVEYEESGFIAGVKWVLAMMQENSAT